MPNVGIITIAKVLSGGKPFYNTYALQNGLFTPGPLNNADLEAFVGGTAFIFTDAATDPDDAEYEGDSSPIACILGFDRKMTAAAVGYTRVYVSDGKTQGDPTGAFATFPLNFGGLTLEASGAEDIAPLNIALQVNRLPASFSQRSGRIQFRAALTKTEVNPFGEDGVSLTAAGRVSAQGRLNEAISSSGIYGELIIAPEGDPSVKLVIPKYETDEGPTKGAVINAADIGGFSLADAVGRQKSRGRKKTAGT